MLESNFSFVSRDDRMDSIKGFLMLLVIWGHVIGSCGTGIINDSVWQLIYSFHMPLFILVSGFFSSIKDNNKLFWKSIVPIIVPLLVFQVINLALVAVVSGEMFSLQYLVTPYWTLWYLLSLVFWRIMLQYSPKCLIENPYLYFALAVAVSVFCGLMYHGRILSIQRTLNFYPFFLLGYYMKQGGMPKKLWHNCMSWVIIGTIIVLIICGVFPFLSFEKTKLLLRGADHYAISDIPLKVCFLIISIVLSVSVFNVIRENKFLSFIGRDSMLYFLYHGLIIKFVLRPFVEYNQLSSGFLFVLLYWIAVVGVIYLIGKIKPIRWLMNPLPTRKNK